MSANTWTIAAARDALRKGEISAVDLTMSCLTAIDAGDGLNAFVHKTPETALKQARAADARLKAGEAPAMCGIPLGIKDLFCTRGVPSQAASNILKGFRPEYESTVTSKLFEAGASASAARASAIRSAGAPSAASASSRLVSST